MFANTVVLVPLGLLVLSELKLIYTCSVELFSPRPAVFDPDLGKSLSVGLCSVCDNYAQSTVTAADDFKRMPPIEHSCTEHLLKQCHASH